MIQKFYRRLMILTAFLFCVSAMQSLAAFEYGGAKLEFMNTKKTNFYGLGFFTSNRRFDAEAEVLISQKLWTNFGAFFTDSGQASTTTTTTTTTGFSDKYTDFSDKYSWIYLAFTMNFHFIRTDKMSWYLGTGIMPLLPRAYVYHFTFGADFFWEEDFRVFYQLKWLENNADAYKYPAGIAFSLGVKYTVEFIK